MVQRAMDPRASGRIAERVEVHQMIIMNAMLNFREHDGVYKGASCFSLRTTTCGTFTSTEHRKSRPGPLLADLPGTSLLARH
jgi:hypothetical protein